MGAAVLQQGRLDQRLNTLALVGAVEADLLAGVVLPRPLRLRLLGPLPCPVPRLVAHHSSRPGRTAASSTRSVTSTHSGSAGCAATHSTAHRQAQSGSWSLAGTCL